MSWNGRQSGFTLMEMLLALVIFSIILMLTFPSFQSTDKKYEEELFFQKLEDDLFLAQQTALSEGTTVVVKFNPSQKFYLVQYVSGKVLFRRDIPQNLALYTNFDRNQFHYNLHGNISQGGRLFFYDTSDNRPLRTYVFQLGNGRFQVEKHG